MYPDFMSSTREAGGKSPIDLRPEGEIVIPVLQKLI